MSLRDRLAELERREAERREKKRQRQERYRRKAADAGKIAMNCYIDHQVKKIIDQEAHRIGGSIGEAVESIVTRDARRGARKVETRDAPMEATRKEPGTPQATPEGLEPIRAAVDAGAFYDEIRVDTITWIEGQKANGRSWPEIARDLNRADIPKRKPGEWTKASVRALVQRRDG